MTGLQTGARKDIPGVIAPPPLIYAGVLAIALAADWLIDGPGLGLPYALRMAGAGAFSLAGVACLALAGRRFQAANTAIPPWKPASALVSSGIYRYTRNPMYVGMALLYIGLALFADSAMGLAGLPVALAIMQFGVIAREERYMEAKFGEAYRDYRAQVRRWI